MKQGDTEGLNLNTHFRTRGHRFKLSTAKFNWESNNNFNRVLDRWNALPETIDNSTGVNKFQKNKLTHTGNPKNQNKWTEL